MYMYYWTYLNRKQSVYRYAMYASSSSLFLAHVTWLVNYTQEVQHVVLLLSELAKYQQTWRRTSPESIVEFEEMSLHLLAYISREGLFRPGAFHGSHLGISCHPVLKEEITSHTRPAIVGCGLSWFAVCARGCTAKEGNGNALCPSQSTPLSTSPLRIGSSPSSSSLLTSSGSTAASFSSALCTEYSDLVAINVYKLVLLLLKFNCKQVHHAVERFENGGTCDYSHFPQLPAPEVLYALQVHPTAFI